MEEGSDTDTATDEDRKGITPKKGKRRLVPAPAHRLSNSPVLPAASRRSPNHDARRTPQSVYSGLGEL
ncbi:hypothetical protein XELAEV_18003487mg, partial [Xenopus laevis]